MYNLNNEDARLLLTQLDTDEYDEFLFSYSSDDGEERTLLEEL
jgi:hypothetical protein